MIEFDLSFPKRVLYALVITGCVGWYPLVRYGNSEIIKAAVVGAVLATVNVLLGYAAIEYSVGKSTTTFFKYVLGGMAVRLFLMAMLLLVFIKVFYFHVAALVASLGILYVIYLVLEVLYIQKKVEIKQHN
jgi:Ca2+/H+ antiporter